MPNIVRPIPRSTTSGSRVYVVRQPSAPIQRSNVSEHLPIRLAIGVITALGVVLLVWLMGHLGDRLGFARIIDVPQLRGDGGQGLTTGTSLLIRIPHTVLQAGLAQPMLLMLGFAMIAIPAAGLSAARPGTPGGPRPTMLNVVFSTAGAVTTGLNAILMTWWTVSPMRDNLVRTLPFSPADAAQWHWDLQTAAGLDMLAVIASALWVVLCFRLAIPLWLKALACSISFFALVVVTVALSLSSAAAAQLAAPRSVCLLEDQQTAGWNVLLGSTEHQVAILRLEDGHTVVQLLPQDTPMTVHGSKSIVDFLVESVPREE
jgi:hypothetical protein